MTLARHSFRRAMLLLSERPHWYPMAAAYRTNQSPLVFKRARPKARFFRTAVAHSLLLCVDNGLVRRERKNEEGDIGRGVIK